MGNHNADLIKTKVAQEIARKEKIVNHYTEEVIKRIDNGERYPDIMKRMRFKVEEETGHKYPGEIINAIDREMKERFTVKDLW